MAAWTLIPCLVALRAEFNTIAPNRDRGADGAIGDSSHTSSSDHTPDEDSNVLRDHDADSKNEVHALDIDSTGPWPDGRTFKSIVLGIIAEERAKWLDPDDRCRLNYVIFDRKIYDKDNDFEPRNYLGSDPHTNHAHFSGRYETSCENDTRPWGVDDMPLNDADKKWLADRIDAAASAAADRVWKAKRNIERAPGAAPYLAEMGAVIANIPFEHGGQSAALASVLTKLGADLVDEQQIVTGVLAGLNPAAIAAAIPAELARQVADELAARLAS